MSIGVVVVCFHTPQETMDCVNMYIAMNSVDHIVIVDNETTTENKAVFEKIDSEKVDVIYQATNAGYSKGNNIGIDFLINKYNVENVIISNSDIVVDENAVCDCVEALKNNDGLGAVAPFMKAPDGSVYPLRYIELGYLRIFLRIFLSESRIDRVTQKYCKKCENMVFQSSLPGSFFVLKSAAIEKCGGFDDKIFLYREEEILGKRMSESGFNMAVCTDCFFVHNHNYKQETPALKSRRNKIVMNSERWYFQEYIKANKLQMLYVNIMQRVYMFTRSVGWRLTGILKKKK